MSNMFQENGCGGAEGGNESSGHSVAVTTPNSSSDIATDNTACRENNSELGDHSDRSEENFEDPRKQQFNELLAQVKAFYEDSNQECRQKLRSATNRNDELSNEAKVSQNKLASMETEIADLKSEVHNKAELIKQLQEQQDLSNRDHESEVKSLVAECNALEECKQRYDEENWELEQQNGRLLDKIKRLENSLGTQESEIRKICYQRDTLKLEKEMLEKKKQEQVDELLSQKGTLENQSRALLIEVKELEESRDKILKMCLSPQDFQAVKRMLDMLKSNVGSSSSSALDSRKRRKSLQSGNTASGSGTFPGGKKDNLSSCTPLLQQ